MFPVYEEFSILPPDNNEQGIVAFHSSENALLA
jgi:hypothetical protein